MTDELKRKKDVREKGSKNLTREKQEGELEEAAIQ